MTTAIVPTVTGWQGGFSNILNRQNGDTVNSYAFPTAAQNGARPPMDSQIARIFKRNTYRGIKCFSSLFYHLSRFITHSTRARVCILISHRAALNCC